MTQKEFEELMGVKVDLMTYTIYNDKYMSTDLNKEDFCNLAKSGQDNVLDELVKVHRRKDKLQEERLEMIDFLIVQSCKWSANDLREQAIAMIGAKNYLRRKLELKLKLWEADKELMLEILSE